jgi:hypothetical protein
LKKLRGRKVERLRSWELEIRSRKGKVEKLK